MKALTQINFEVHFLFLDYALKHIKTLSQKKTKQTQTYITQTEPKGEYSNFQVLFFHTATQKSWVW